MAGLRAVCAIGGAVPVKFGVPPDFARARAAPNTCEATDAMNAPRFGRDARNHR